MILVHSLKELFQLFDRRKKKAFWGIIVLMVIGAFMEMMGISIIFPIVSIIIEPKNFAINKYFVIISDFLNIRSERVFLLYCLVGMVFIYLFKNIYLILEYRLQYRFIFNCRYDVQTTLFRNIVRKSYIEYLYIDTAQVQSIIVEDVLNSFVLFMNVLTILTEIITVTVVVIFLLVINFQMTMMVSAVLSIAIWIIFKKVKPILQFEAMNKKLYWEGLCRWIIQAIRGVKEVKIEKGEEFFCENFNINTHKFLNAERRNVLWQNMPRMIIEFFGIFSVLLYLIISIQFGTDLVDLVPTISAFAVAAARLMPSANRISGAYNQISFFKIFLDDLLVYYKNDTQCEAEDAKYSKLERYYFKDSIQISHATFHYPDVDKNILDDVSLTIKKGKSIGIIGSSGNGKTTLVDVILGLLPLQSGEILVDGVRINEDENNWLSCVSYIPQTIFLLNDTVRNNILFCDRNKYNDDTKVWEALTDAKLDKFVEELPEGLDTMIGEGGINLSGGQRQRIVIARALYKKPDILVLDEATSALDGETEKAIMETINALQKRITMIIIAHRLQTIQNCDEVYKVEDGEIKKVDRELIKEK